MMRKVEINPTNSFFGILITIGVLVGLYFLVKGFFAVLSIITPGLLIGAAILNWRVFPDYAKWIWKQLNSNVILGIIAILFTVFLLPVTAGYLFVKAYFRYKGGKMVKEMNQKREAEFAEFEEIKDDVVKPLELPRIEKRTVDKPQETTDYDQLFD